MDTIDLHRRTVEYWTRVVEGVGDEQWDRPTPCVDWLVRELVNHVAGEDLWTAPLMRGSTIEEVGDRFDGYLLGDEPVARARAAAAAATDAVAEMLPTDGTVQLSYGEERMDEYVRQLAADHLVHGWDLAVATGADVTTDPDLVEEVAGWYAEREELYRRAGLVADRPASAGVDAQSELIAAFGRDPGWAPPAG